MRKEYKFYVYIMASESGTLYTGMTNDLARRNYEHKNNLVEGFSKKYKCHKLIYFEETNNVEEAIKREKQIKNWSRKKKESLIQTKNPTWRDLSDDF